MAARILVVEDNPPNRALMEYLLRAFGHQVLTATDGRAGVERAVAEHPDLILMDLQLPVLTGFEALRSIRKVRALDNVPVIAVTAQAMVGDSEKAHRHGFDGYITKPIVPETFVTEIEAFLPVAMRSGRPPSS